MAPADYQRLIGEARQNEIKMRRFQAMELRLLEATSLAQLCELLVVEYRSVFGLDIIALHLFDAERELMRLEHSRELLRLRNVYIHHSPSNRIERLGGNRPRPTLFDPVAHRDLFPATREAIGSLCLLPLRRRDKLIGLFVLGSHDPRRFGGGDSTDFLQRLCAITAICMENAVNVERLRQAGLRDPLTDLYNRRHFNDSMRREIMVAQRQQRTLACLYMDIDHFKRINDEHGHPAGDIVLQGIASNLRSLQRRSEILARLGGEEFALLLPATDLQAAAAAGERIREQIESSVFEYGDHQTIRVTISCGVAALCPQHQEDLEIAAESLLVAADNALLQAKNGGRNQVIKASPFDPSWQCGNSLGPPCEPPLQIDLTRI